MNTDVAPTVRVLGLENSPYTVSGDYNDLNTWIGTVNIDYNREQNTATINVADANDLAGNLMVSVDANTFYVDSIYEFEFPKTGNGFQTGPMFGDTISRSELENMGAWDANFTLENLLNSSTGPDSERLTTANINNLYVYNETQNSWVTIASEDFNTYNLYNEIQGVNYFVFDLGNNVYSLSIRHNVPNDLG
jgi:hypothetical protein